jgi:lipoate-protein ligase A
LITLFYESNPAEAMAHDEALLNHSARHSLCLRGYQWQTAALTAGVFCSLSTPPSIPWARRITGGGLVLHGCDLTFTVVADDIPNRKAYAFVGESLTRALNQLGIPAEVSGLDSKVSGIYACFGAPVAGD